MARDLRGRRASQADFVMIVGLTWWKLCRSEVMMLLWWCRKDLVEFRVSAQRFAILEIDVMKDRVALAD